MHFNKNKKSQIFILVAIALMALLFVSFGVYSTVQDRSPISSRINTMDSFLSSIETNLQRQMYIVGYRGIFLAEANATASGPIKNVSEFIGNAFFNNVSYDDFCNSANLNDSIMCGARYVDILGMGEDGINNKSALMNLKVNISNPAIYVYQASPWDVAVNFQFDLIMNDSNGLASWKKRENITSLVSIIGFEDPLYVIGTGGRYPHNIKRTPYDGYYASGVDNLQNLSLQLSEGYYAANPIAPSFLNRLAGKFSADPNGIESFVDISELSNKMNTGGEPYTPRAASIIDYIYFDTSSNLDVVCIKDPMPHWFRIDQDHRAKYNISESGFEIPCTLASPTQFM